MTAVSSNREGRVLTVEITNPPFNFLTAPIVNELNRVTALAAKDPTIGAIVLTSGVERIFISHYDVAEILEGGKSAPVVLGPRAAAATLRLAAVVDRLPGGRRALERSMMRGIVLGRRYQELARRLRTIDKPTIAGINGRAFGGGCELALSCDVRLMADDLDQPDGIGQPEILVGIIPGGGGSQMLPRIVGAGRALELMLEGRLLTSQEALASGLVHRLVAREDVVGEAHATAQRLARRAPAAVAAIKRAVHKAPGPLEAGLRIEAAGFLSTATLPTGTASMTRYIEWLAPRIARNDGGMTAGDLEYWRSGEWIAAPAPTTRKAAVCA
jgi:enoyl-CoA hydratase/carnithine racemase